MLPPFLPFQYSLYLQGVHFTYARFFPIEYVRRVLELNEPFAEPENASLEDILAFYKGKGVDYDAIHKECYERYGNSHRQLANYASEDFEGIVVDNTFYEHHQEEAHRDDVDVKQFQARDKDVLQNYGRPYNEQGKPTGSFYKFAKQFPSGVQV